MASGWGFLGKKPEVFLENKTLPWPKWKIGRRLSNLPFYHKIVCLNNQMDILFATIVLFVFNFSNKRWINQYQLSYSSLIFWKLESFFRLLKQVCRSRIASLSQSWRLLELEYITELKHAWNTTQLFDAFSKCAWTMI